MEMTLGEFVKQLTVKMEEANLVMLFKEEKPWHLLFYKLKKDASKDKPEFLINLRFDWDGPFPRCKQLSEFIQALHWTGSVVAGNPSYERISLQGEIKQLWSNNGRYLPAEMHTFLERSIELARNEFPAHA